MSAQAETPDQKTPTKKQEPGVLERRLFRVVLAILGLTFLTLVFGSFMPNLSFLIVLPFLMVELIWCYACLASFFVTFPVAFHLAKRRGAKSMSATKSAIRWSIIVFAVIGLVLWPTCFLIPGYKPFTLGNWIHAKLWLNVAEVRQWAALQDVSTDPRHGIPYRQWPTSLKMANWGAGRLLVDPSTKTVRVIDGGGFGHWGIYIAPAGISSPQLSGYTIQLEDGAWVWHELQ